MITSPILRAPRVHLPGTKKGPLKLKWRIARSSEMQSNIPVCLTEMYSVMNCWDQSRVRRTSLCKTLQIVRFMHCVRIQTAYHCYSECSNLSEDQLDLEQEGALSKTAD